MSDNSTHVECKVCGNDLAIRQKITKHFMYKDAIITVPDYEVITCNRCGESVATVESVEKSIPILKRFKKDIDDSLLCRDCNISNYQMNDKL